MSGQEQQGGNGNAGTDMAWMIAGFFAAVLAIWFSYKEYILIALLTLKYYEMLLINMLFGRGTRAVAWLDENRFTPLEISNADITGILSYVGSFYSYLVVVVMFGFAYYLIVQHPSGKFKKVFNMKSLRNQEKETWPQITPTSSIDLIKEDIAEGPWAMAMSPMEFSQANDLLIPPKRDPRNPNADMVATINKAKALRCFKKQIGAKFQGPDKLPIYMKALAGVFTARLFEERKLPAILMSQMSASSSEIGQIDFTGAEELWARYKDEKLTQAIMSRHAYVFTVMASLLEAARIDGVMASSDFLWLKAVDRRLWYILNNVGRQTAFPEVGGAFAHWRAEKAVGRALNNPVVDEAVKALEEAISSVVYTGDKEKWELI